MFEKVIKAIEPFALTLVALAGASQAGWVDFSNDKVVGILVFGFGIMLIIAHIARQMKSGK